MSAGKIRQTIAKKRNEAIVDRRKGRVPHSRWLNHVKIVAPSTSANLGPGFDVFGLAHDTFQDSLEIEVTSSSNIEIEITGVNQDCISRDLDKNTAGFVAKCLSDRLPDGRGLRIHIDKGIPVGKGLGSSGASAAACILGLNRIMDLRLSKDEMIQLAARGEIASAGSPHADNAAASILGGFTIVQSYQPFHAIGLSPPDDLGIALALPDISVSAKKTQFARAILPKSVSMAKMIHNIGNASAMIVGIMSADLKLIGRSMTDAVVEPKRARLVPGYQKVRKSALDTGALGVAISGAGPTMIAIVHRKKTPPIRVAEAMKAEFEAEGIACQAFSSKPAKGAKIVEEG